MADPTGESRRKKVTIYDIAEAAGVAPSTVSRAFTRPGRVHSDTARLIHETAQRLGYRVRPIPRVETGEATNVLAFVVADVANPVYAHIMKGFQREASSYGYTVLLIDTDEDALNEKESLGRIMNLVDGVVLGASRLSDSAINQAAMARPLVSVNRFVSGVPSIAADTGRGMRRSVEYLAQLGHERFTYLSGPLASWADGMRWRAVSEACHELELSVRRVATSLPTIEGGLAAARQWREQPTTAVIGFNDSVAIGFMKAVQRSGLSVPDDVSVIGVDNSISSVLTTPTLTTVAPSTSLIGARAARALIAQLKHRSSGPGIDRVVVPMEMFVRESVGPARVFSIRSTMEVGK